MRYITAKQLRDLGACKEQYVLFRETFGERAACTEANIVKAMGRFEINWIAEKLLSAPALKLYDETQATAWKLYDETHAPALKLYDETCAPALKLYEETCVPASKFYEETCARIFIKLYNEERSYI